MSYLVAVLVHVRQGALSALVVDSDVEHFPDVISALLHYPIGPEVVAQQGLEATPVGLAYHYVHASLSALGGGDAFGTALPAHFLMLALGVSGVYVFARSFMGLAHGGALLATVLYAGGALPLVVASFGWGQQTAALATVPVALAALRLGVCGRDRRSLWAAGLLGALASRVSVPGDGAPGGGRGGGDGGRRRGTRAVPSPPLAPAGDRGHRGRGGAPLAPLRRGLLAGAQRRGAVAGG